MKSPLLVLALAGLQPALAQPPASLPELRQVLRQPMADNPPPSRQLSAGERAQLRRQLAEQARGAGAQRH